MTKPTFHPPLRQSLMITSKHELIALLAHGWKAVRNSSGWHVVGKMDASTPTPGRAIVIPLHEPELAATSPFLDIGPFQAKLKPCYQ